MRSDRRVGERGTIRTFKMSSLAACAESSIGGTPTARGRSGTGLHAPRASNRTTVTHSRLEPTQIQRRLRRCWVAGGKQPTGGTKLLYD